MRIQKTKIQFLKIIIISVSMVALVWIILVPSKAYAVINQAQITSTTTADPDITNNTAQSADVPISYQVDLQISTNIVTTPIYPGLPVDFNFVITNNGPSTVTSVSTSGYNPASLSSPTYSLPNGATFNNGVVSGISLASGQSITFGVNAVVNANVETDITNLAKVLPASGVTETNSANNQQSYTLDITPIADLSLSKTTNETTLVQGNTVKYTLTGTNNGPSTAQPNIVITDNLPVQLTFISIDTQQSSNGWSCGQNNQVLTCTNTNQILNGGITKLIINLLVK